MFPKSKHIVDNESSVEESIALYTPVYDGEVMNNYSFIDSKNDRMMQVSDIFVGLVGKLSKFLNSTPFDEIKASVDSMNQIQFDNLDKYLDVISKSDRKNKALFHNFNAPEELRKHALLFELRNKQY